ncbi:MAG: indole-3-glycerol phosphate synthase TrpC [Bacillota bacterium]
MLDRIIEHKRTEIEARKETCSLAQLERMAASAPPARGFGVNLRRPGKVAVIAEIKRASPSKGPIKPDADPAEVARVYAASGAAAISVLTDRRFFQGDPYFIGIVRREAGLPILRKDFIIDPYQVYESKALGADAMLLITRVLKQQELKELLNLAQAIGMECLVEVHDEEEVERALDAGAKVIGINNRDLQTFQTDIKITLRLRRLIPTEVAVVSESGISSAAAMRSLRENGVDAALIGEALMAASNMGAKLQELVEAGSG